MNLDIREIEARDLSRLVAQNIQCHHTSKRMSNNMYVAMLLEARIVLTPEPVDAICFLGDRPDHFGLVVRHIIGYVKHDVTD